MKALKMQGICTERLCFDHITSKEAELWLDFYRSDENRRFLGVEELSPELAWKKRLEREAWRNKHNLGSSALLRRLDNGEAIGSCGLLIQNVNGRCLLEIGYGLFEHQRGMGFASEAAQACMDVALQLKPAIAVHCVIHHENKPSMQVAIRMGMQEHKEELYKGTPVKIFRRSLK